MLTTTDTTPVGTARLESIWDGLLQVATAIRSIPQDVDASALLRDAAALIEDPKRWTQGADARMADMESCDADDPEAVCWCMTGALIKIMQRDAIPRSVIYALRDLADDIADFNDSHTHDEVLRAMREAAESLEKE